MTSAIRDDRAPAQLETAEVETAELAAASLETADVDTVELETAELDTAELETAELETAPGETAPDGTARPGPTSGELLRRAATGDQEAWDRLVERYAGMVWDICRSAGLDRHEAADVAQVVWLRLVENLGRLRDAERVGSWLATTAKRERLRALRRRSRECAETTETADPTPGPYERVEQAERVRVLSAALSRLPERDRALLRTLAEPDRPSYAELSAALDIPVGSIGPTRMRALARLREELGREFG
jgi:RNA polymerase sigma factor (sigma-70 family)